MTRRSLSISARIAGRSSRKSASNSRWASGSPTCPRAFGSLAKTRTTFKVKCFAKHPSEFFQLHTGYSFRQGQWFAVDANYYSGGATSVNGRTPINELSNSRYGVTFSQPVGAGLSAKASWSHWLSGRYGQNFATVAVALQYLWFDRH